MKDINKELLSQLNGVHKLDSKRPSIHSPTKSTEPSSYRKIDNASKIHNLYQDLYVNDLKAEIADIEDHLKFTKEKLRESELEVTELKRQNHQQNMIIKRYKKMVAEINSNGGTGSHPFLQKGDGNNVSHSDMQILSS